MGRRSEGLVLVKISTHKTALKFMQKLLDIVPGDALPWHPNLKWKPIADKAILQAIRRSGE